MMNYEILQPVVVLIIWTLVVWAWMYATRIPAMKLEPGIDPKTMVGSTPGSLDAVLPARVQWVAHNYNHLHEQPTIFYALALTIAFMGHGNGINATIAWAYVVLRIAHSLVQILSNRVIIRFGLFILASLCLISLTVHATYYVFGLHGEPLFRAG